MVDLRAQLEAHISGAGAHSIQHEVVQEHRKWRQSEDAQAAIVESQKLAAEQHEASSAHHRKMVEDYKKAVDEAKGLPPQGDLRSPEEILSDALGQ